MITTQDRLSEWMEVYSKELLRAVEKYPEDYAYKADFVPVVCERMRQALISGDFNKEGRAIKATCKYFGISYSYKAINEFLKGETQ